MLLQVKLVIQMTGLLLLTPNSREDTPLHVLMPEPFGFRTHVAEIGYRWPSEVGCQWYDRVAKICYRDMSNYVMDIKPQTVNPAPEPATLGDGLANVSAGSGRRVKGRDLTGLPGLFVRSRITLHAGKRVDSCQLGSWEFRGEPMSLDNVVTWEIPDAASTQFVLTRRRFGSETDDTLAVLPAVENVVELFIHHVPPMHRAQTYLPLARVRAQNRAPVARRSVAKERATHFHAFYNLLGAGVSRPIPEATGYTGRFCTWATSADFRRVSIIPPPSVGTLSCILARGDPP